jgi:hypothetical protein
MSALTISIPSFSSQNELSVSFPFTPTNRDNTVMSCSNPVIGVLLGCIRHAPGVMMNNEHGISCIHAVEMSPQRYKMCVQYAARLMPIGEAVLLMDPIYTQTACSLMKIEIDDSEFVAKWNAFVTEEKRKTDEWEEVQEDSFLKQYNVKKSDW